MKVREVFVLAAGAMLPMLSNASCGTAYCAANSNWNSESAAMEPGSTLDLRYEFIKQDRLRSGNADAGEEHAHHREVSTVNRNIMATYSFKFNSSWGVSISAPVVERDHVHVHNHHGEELNEQWNFKNLGDVRVVGRYQMPYLGNPLKPVSTGFTFGLKLPTGKTGLANADGDKAERTLQPGTGTTDAIVGAYFHQKLTQSGASWFAQMQNQHALNAHEGYRPGDQFSLDVGYRHGLTDKTAGLIQANFVHRQRDSGAQAEPADSGGRWAYISPGVAYSLSDKVQAYGFLQKPIYQKVNGEQLVSDKAFVVGVTGRF